MENAEKKRIFQLNGKSRSMVNTESPTRTSTLSNGWSIRATTGMTNNHMTVLFAALLCPMVHKPGQPGATLCNAFRIRKASQRLTSNPQGGEGNPAAPTPDARIFQISGKGNATLSK